MKFHSKYCSLCKSNKIFLEKLTKPNDPNCTEIEDVCQGCKTPFKTLNKLKVNI